MIVTVSLSISSIAREYFWTLNILNFTSVASAISELAAVVKAVSEQVSELAKSVETVNNEVASVKDNFDEFGKRVDAVEADTAVRKSGDLGGIVQLQKNNNKKESVWGGRFLKSADL